MTPEELVVVNLLAEAWDAFLKLPVNHSDDTVEFRHAIHQAQHLVAARQAWIQTRDERKLKLRV